MKQSIEYTYDDIVTGFSYTDKNHKYHVEHIVQHKQPKALVKYYSKNIKQKWEFQVIDVSTIVLGIHSGLYTPKKFVPKKIKVTEHWDYLPQRDPENPPTYLVIPDEQIKSQQVHLKSATQILQLEFDNKQTINCPYNQKQMDWARNNINTTITLIPKSQTITA